MQRMPMALAILSATWIEPETYVRQAVRSLCAVILTAQLSLYQPRMDFQIISVL